MSRKNETITSEEDAQVDTQADTQAEPAADPDPALQVGPEAQGIHKPGERPSSGQKGGTRVPAAGYISAGVKSDVEIYGSTIDPATGKRVTAADLDI